MIDLAEQLASAEGQRGFARHMAGLIRSMEFESAAALIKDGLAKHPSSFSFACRNLPPEQVRISGWDELFADIAKVEARGKICTAIGINLSGHHEGDEPYFEVALYDDSSFPFATATRDDILAQCEDYGVPWQGRFIDGNTALRCHGLASVFAALTGYEHHDAQPDPGMPAPFIGFKLAQWFVYLRVAQALKQELASRGLPRRMPVLLGEHDFGDWFATAYMSARIADTSAVVDQVAQRRLAESRARFDATVEEQVDMYRSARETINSFGRFFLSEMEKSHIDFCDTIQTNELKRLGLQLDRPSWKLSDREFERFLDRYRQAWRENTRAGRELFAGASVTPPPPPPPVSPTLATAPLPLAATMAPPRPRGFGRKGL
ncbi:MAG: hypothetical protein K2Y20_11445 [Sphingomonas sp.]|nr:hypothetical protein [Sphingomonas sp.]